ncbi:MAG: TrkA family potassium uptake protein [Thermoleophilaceae bacterium]|nr:TrkA family potassium uptake protein [Thermoleophilaceae bacterium]
MYVVVVGGGKVGLNLTRELMLKGHELTLIEKSRSRYSLLEPQLEHIVHYGDGTELWVLERAGIERADMVIAVTGDDEDNIIICQVAREKYGKERIIARANNIRNLDHFSLLNIKPVVSSTDLILRLIEHEVPQYGLVHLLTLQAEGLEIIEVEVNEGSLAVGKAVADIDLPEGSLLISVLRDGGGFVPRPDTVINSGDEVLLVLNPGIEQDITKFFITPDESFA